MCKQRKQVYIEECHERALKRLSAKHGHSEAMLIREALDRYLANATMPSVQDPAAWRQEQALILRRIRGKGVKGHRTWTRDGIHDRR
jgi:hypothetical protein